MKLKTLIAATLMAFAMISCDDKKDHEVQVMEEEVMETAALDVAVVNTFDPICEMEIPKFLKDTLNYQNEVYGFCSAGCKAEFAADPEKYLAILAEGASGEGHAHDHGDHDGHDHEGHDHE